MDKEFKNGQTDIDANYIKMIIKNFNKALKENADTVYIGYEVIDDFKLKEYNIERSNWKKILDMFLKIGVNLEEYELCSQIKKLIEKIS